MLLDGEMSSSKATWDVDVVANPANEKTEQRNKSVPEACFAVQITLRTYILASSLLLGPSLLPVATALVRDPQGLKDRLGALKLALSKELGSRGLPFALAVAVGGGQCLKLLWETLKKQPKSSVPASRRSSHSLLLLFKRTLRGSIQALDSKLTAYQKVFTMNAMASGVVAAVLLHRRDRSYSSSHRRPGTKSSTLDLTLWLLVHALDALVQSRLLSGKNKATSRCASAPTRDVQARGPSSEGEPSNDIATSEILSKERIRINAWFDGLLFWACSARIMWCFFYEPQRLPRSYVKWIDRLARVDWRLLELLRAVRQGNWSYIHGSDQHGLASTLASDLRYPTSWGNPELLPAHGGQTASRAWAALGVNGRDGVGGLPCQLVHGRAVAWFGLADSCVANAIFRAVYALMEAFVIYLPVYFTPLLLTQPRSILRPGCFIPRVASAMRSAAFLSAFISSYWFAVCMTRTLVLARLLPNISHDTWDGPYGGTFAGSLVCGTSILIESAKRRGDMALYVLPKGLRASIPNNWIKSPAAKFVECAIFTLSMATLSTTAVYSPDALRGLAGWMAAFIMKGLNVTAWRKREQSTTDGLRTDVQQLRNVHRN